MNRPIKIALLTTDGREHDRRYSDPEPDFGKAPLALLQGLAQLPDCEVHVVSCLKRPVRSPEKLASNTYYHSVLVPKWGWMRGFYLGCILAARRTLRRIQPDIVHGQGTERDCAISAVFSGFPNVITIHGSMNAIAQMHHARMGSYHWLAARLENLTLPRTAGIICISDYVKDLVQRYGVQTWLLPNAIRQMFFDLPLQRGPSTARPLLMNVGVISERKRQQQLLAVLRALRQEGLGFDTLFVGAAYPGSYPATFTAMLREANQQLGGFEHIEKLDDTAFCRLFDRASAMIHSASQETFGLTFAEAIARGLYLFASDVGGIRDIAKGVGRVEIFGVDKEDDLKEALRQWLVKERYKEPRPPGPPLEFTHRYHPLFVAQKHLEIYKEVLGLPSQGRPAPARTNS